jgi:hypothetical protein
LTRADNPNIYAASSQVRPARFIFGDAPAMIVVGVDGLGASRDNRAGRPSNGCDNRGCDGAHMLMAALGKSDDGRLAAIVDRGAYG